MDKQNPPKFYPGAAIKKAFERLKDEGIHLKTVCTEIGGLEYYNKIYGHSSRSKSIDAETLEPLLERLPTLREFLDNYDGRTPEQRIAALEHKLKRDQAELKEMLDSVLQRLNEIDSKSDNTQEYIAALKKLSNLE